MSEFDLLSAVQPGEGWFAVVGINSAGVKQVLVQTREEADAAIQSFVEKKRDVFFGVAKYKDGLSRKKDNVRALKAFWLDIDCGETKAVVNEKTGKAAGYIDQNTALEALMKFCGAVGLPRPIVVNSGRGVHVYWALTEEITRSEWEPVAAKLSSICVERSFFVDPAIFEVARILRVPGTFNHKDNPPTLVEVLVQSKPIEFAKFKSLLGVEEAVDTSASTDIKLPLKRVWNDHSLLRL